jgi:hypothetical protein
MTIDNKGFIYENKVNSNLKKTGLLTPGFIPAGADSNAPDAQIRFKGKDYKIEVKLDLNVDFGQGSLSYDINKKTDNWVLSGSDTISGKQMRQFLEFIGVPRIVNKQWGPKGPPRKFTVLSKNFKKSDVDFDYKNFKDVFIDIPSNSVAKYYNSKNTYYIQIGGKGFYYMGKDIANLNVSKFNLLLKLRIRLKRGGSMPLYNYRFTTAIQAVKGTLSDSNANLDNLKYLKELSNIGK